VSLTAAFKSHNASDGGFAILGGQVPEPRLSPRPLRRALDRVGGLGAVPSKLCDDGVQGANRIQSDVTGNQRVSSW
jgi:hypothetical protein